MAEGAPGGNYNRSKAEQDSHADETHESGPGVDTSAESHGEDIPGATSAEQQKRAEEVRESLNKRKGGDGHGAGPAAAAGGGHASGGHAGGHAGGGHGGGHGGGWLGTIWGWFALGVNIIWHSAVHIGKEMGKNHGKGGGGGSSSPAKSSGGGGGHH